MTSLSKIAKALTRFSTYLRGAWMLMALLHLWLIVHRAATGGLDSIIGWSIAAFCFAGVVYCSLKFWQVATFFDKNPRRALAFALILLIGHGLMQAPELQASDPWHTSPETVAMLILAPALAATVVVLLSKLIRRFLDWLFRPRPILQPIPVKAPQRPPRDRYGESLLRRPPPSRF